MNKLLSKLFTYPKLDTRKIFPGDHNSGTVEVNCGKLQQSGWDVPPHELILSARFQAIVGNISILHNLLLFIYAILACIAIYQTNHDNLKKLNNN